ncbi:hypothetical protein [Planctomicrobium sp. SH527]|uniref:hypothetical protein n=1 Tax=Planctomicrobium sp. SH527 TaxID=3448123 RepID=UPI003F5CA546
MRLTLRTILAYLDDVLPPGQAREIGEKITEGKEASALVARIRDVLRRRRIGAPEIAGPGSGPDPNVVSEYLENLLPPNQVVELERLCQASDVHLAEVAACHKVLTMVLGQPIDVSDELSERMYLLGSDKAAHTAKESAPTQPMTEGMGKSSTSPFSSGLPDYLLQKPFLQRYRIPIIVTAVFAGWLALIANDSSLWNKQTDAPPLAETVTEPTGADVAMNGAKGGGTPAPNSGADAPVVMGSHPIIAAPPAGAQPGEEVPKLTPGQTPLNDVEMPAVATPAPTAPMTPADPRVAMPAPNNTPPMAGPVVPVLPETQPELDMTYLSGDSVVVEANSTRPGWHLASEQLEVEVGQEIASPVPFRNSYRIGDNLQLTLHPGTRVQRIIRTNGTDVGILLRRGQLNFYHPAESQNPTGVRLRILGRDWVISALTPGTRFGIELIPPTPNGPPAEMHGMSIGGGIVVAEGRISVVTAGQPVMELTPESGYARWPVEGSGLVTKVDLTIPEWAQPDPPIMTPAARQFAKHFQKEFAIGQPILDSIGPITKDRRAGISDLAVKTMALISEWEVLVPALKSDHQESRLSAIDGLRQWLAVNPGQEEALKVELAKTFAAEKVDSIVRLLWGFNAEDAENPEQSKQLIEWMKDDEIAIRELAFFYVSKLTARTHDYLPMAPPAERKSAVQRWEEYLKRNNGTLVAN